MKVIVSILKENTFYHKNVKKSIVEEDHTKVSSSKFEWATSTGTPFRKLESFNRKLADSTAGVAPSTYPKPIQTIPTNTLGGRPSSSHSKKHLIYYLF